MNTSAKAAREKTLPWGAWPTISEVARVNGWKLMAERAGVARIERRDPRSDTGAVLLHIEFDCHGRIARAWMGLGRTVGERHTDKLGTIVSWLTECISDSQERPAGLQLVPTTLK